MHSIFTAGAYRYFSRHEAGCLFHVVEDPENSGRQLVHCGRGPVNSEVLGHHSGLRYHESFETEARNWLTEDCLDRVVLAGHGRVEMQAYGSPSTLRPKRSHDLSVVLEGRLAAEGAYLNGRERSSKEDDVSQ